MPIAGHRTRFRARNLFHGVNQHRQPGALVAFRSPCPELLTHRLSLTRRLNQLESLKPVPELLDHHAGQKIRRM
jgi:hypothetical protein